MSMYTVTVITDGGLTVEYRTVSVNKSDPQANVLQALTLARNELLRDMGPHGACHCRGPLDACCSPVHDKEA